MKYVLIAIEDDAEAQRFVEDAAEYPDHALLTPSQENDVHFRIVTVLAGRPGRPDGCIRCGCIVGHDGDSCGGKCGGDAQGAADSASSRALTAVDPEPPVGWVGIDCDGLVWHHRADGWHLESCPADCAAAPGNVWGKDGGITYPIRRLGGDR